MFMVKVFIAFSFQLCSTANVKFSLDDFMVKVKMVRVGDI